METTRPDLPKPCVLGITKPGSGMFAMLDMDESAALQVKILLEGQGYECSLKELIYLAPVGLGTTTRVEGAIWGIGKGNPLLGTYTKEVRRVAAP